MVILCGILTFALSVQTFYSWKYRRQVRDICRQMSFVMRHDSNMIITNDLRARGIEELTDLLNEEFERQRSVKRRYDEKEKIISAMYTNLSHDIRTPLTSLDGYCQMAMDSDSKAEQRRYFEIIRERITSLRGMLEEIFTFAKVTDEAYQIDLEKCCINQILKDTVFSYYDDWIQRGIDPEISITDELLYIEGNVQGLRRVLQNIIKNGLDHGDKRIKISLHPAGGDAVLRISNRMSGLENIDVHQVFERFYKGDTARSKTSTGLGLSIARELVQRMNGEIKAEASGGIFCIQIRFHRLQNL